MHPLIVRPTAMVHGGAALARLDDGRAVFVDGALPEESVTIELTSTRPRHASAVMTAVIGNRSAARVVPRCPNFGDWPGRGREPAAACGGCNWQHVDYAAQLEFKRAILADTLRRIGGIDAPPVRPMLGMDEPWHYRNHVRMRTLDRGLAFVTADGRALKPVSDCTITHPLVLELVAIAQDLGLPGGSAVRLRAGTATGDQMIVVEVPADSVDEVEVDVDISVAIAHFEGGSQGAQLGDRGRDRPGPDPADSPDATLAMVDAEDAYRDIVMVEVAAGRPYLVETVLGRSFLVPPTGFFQSNTVMAERLVETVKAWVPKTVRVVDVYSGVGLFAAHLADQAGEVIAIEVDPAAVAAGVENASDLEHLTYVEGDAAEGLDWVEGDIPVAVVDPPRGGLERGVLDRLAARVTERLVYVSCEPSTLARDASRLRSAGWTMRDCQPVDMFPQTSHIESVSLFERDSSVRLER